MKARDYAAITTGGLSFVAAVIAQWYWTQRPIEDVIFIAFMIGFMAVCAYVGITEQRKPKRRKHRARPIDRYEDWRPYFITLDKEEWERARRV